MCNFFSCIVTENGDALFDPISDSHEIIISNNAKNYDLSDDTADPAELKFARVEILPPNDDVFQPVDKWNFTIDQRIIPAWWSEFHKKQAYDCLNTFLDSVLLKDKKIQELSTGRYWVRDCQIAELKGDVLIVKMLGSSQVGEMRDSSQICEMWGSSQVDMMWDSSQIREMWGSSQVGEMRDSSQVGEMWGSSRIHEMWGSSQVGMMLGSSQVGVMRESSQVGMMRGSSQVGEMWESSRVGEMRKSSQVGVMRGSSRVGEMMGSSQIRKMCESSTVKIVYDKNIRTAPGYYKH